jgi:hypothetical protein
MRNVYFAFHYQRDIFRVNQVRNSGLLFGARSVGFADQSLWERARTRGDEALERLILDGLVGTTATVVLIGRQTASRRWVEFEIEESYERGNALLGVEIHHLRDHFGNTDSSGPTPDLLIEIDAPIYRWRGDPHDLGDWVEEAIEEQQE